MAQKNGVRGNRLEVCQPELSAVKKSPTGLERGKIINP